METKKTSKADPRPANNEGRSREITAAREQLRPDDTERGGEVAQPRSEPRQKAERIDAELLRALRPQAIEQISLEMLKPRERNARRHSERQIQQLAASLRQFGFIGAIIIDEAGNVLAGHGRLAAAKLVGLREVPCVRVGNLDETGKAAFALADNRLAELSGWDDEMLKIELGELEAIGDFDLEITGFDTVDLDRLLGPEPDPHANPDDNIPELFDDKPAVSALGDLWILGQHRLLCGDALKPENYTRLLGNEEVDPAVDRMILDLCQLIGILEPTIGQVHGAAGRP